MSYPLWVYVGLNRPHGREMLIGHHGSPSLWAVILTLRLFKVSELRSNMNLVCFTHMQNIWCFDLGDQSPNPKLLRVSFVFGGYFCDFYVDQLYDVAKACLFSTFFISTVRIVCAHFITWRNYQSAVCEYSIEIKIRISGYQIIWKRTAL